MEDFLRFIVIAGIIVVSIVRHYRKDKADNPAGTLSAPEPEIIEEVFPVPPVTSHKTSPPRGTSAGRMNANNPTHERKPAAAKPYANVQRMAKQSAARHEFLSGETAGTTTPQHSIPATPDVSPNRTLFSAKSENDYSLSSPEEARKAIVWAEILQRKY